jgi:FkbM family methyltransferase
MTVKDLQAIDPLANAIASLRDLLLFGQPVPPVPSSRPLTGPFITAVRRFAWRLAGRSLRRDIDRDRAFQKQVVTLLRRIERLTTSPFHFRAGTWDEHVFRTVHDNNEYRLPDHLDADDVVIDIGMHIGSFCLAALERGSHCVHGFEAERGNYACAVRNLSPFGERVHCYHQAVFRSDRAGDRLFHPGYAADGANTAGGSVLWAGSGEEMKVVAFDDILRRLTEGGRRRIKLLKIDCEGSEFPILFTSRLVHLIDHIHGEYHEIPAHNIPPASRLPGVAGFTRHELKRFLSGAGFEVEFVPPAAAPMGLFFARHRQAPSLEEQDQPSRRRNNAAAPRQRRGSDPSSGILCKAAQPPG